MEERRATREEEALRLRAQILEEEASAEEGHHMAEAGGGAHLYYLIWTSNSRFYSLLPYMDV